MSKKCEFCAIEFEPKSSKQKFCSKQCTDKSCRQKKKLATEPLEHDALVTEPNNLEHDALVTVGMVATEPLEQSEPLATEPNNLEKSLHTFFDTFQKLFDTFQNRNGLEKLYTIKEFAEYIDTDVRFIDKIIKDHNIKVLTISERNRRIKESEIKKYIDSLE